ncbi:MAG TPA: hypothetical protein VF665_04900, partial [Longimicrobium sp.]|uniref:hypothetical protein n=1 Tax=Longimicrobium sp. TaxID=2029185 RepID=UPI002ED9F030
MNAITSLPLAEWLAVLAQLALKATLILALTAAASTLLWRASAAVRHMVWCVGVVCVLALPVFSVLIPAWEVPILPAAASASTARAPSALDAVASADNAVATAPGAASVDDAV